MTAEAKIIPAVEDRHKTIAYMMSRFPKITETFVLREIIEMQNQGQSVEIFPLIKHNEEVAHEEAISMMHYAHYYDFLNREVIWSNISRMLSNPTQYLKVLADISIGTSGSFNLFFGALAVFPKAVHIAREMEQLGIAHIHAHFSTHPTTAAYIVSELTGIPYSFTAHSHDIFEYNSMLDRKTNHSIFAATVCEYNKRFMVDKFPNLDPGKIEIHRCGIYTGSYSPHAVRSSDKSGFTLICVAALERRKGIHHLIRACAMVRDRIPGLKCLVVGRGEEKAFLESVIRETGTGDVVELLGGQPQDKVTKLLGAADVMVLATELDAVPVAIMEAMACGLPVVSSRLTGIPELVEDSVTGILTQPGDVVAVANAIHALYENPEMRHSMGQRGRAKVETEYDLSKNATRLRERIQRQTSSLDTTAVTPANIAIALRQALHSVPVSTNSSDFRLGRLRRCHDGRDSVVFHADSSSWGRPDVTSGPVVIKIGRPPRSDETLTIGEGREDIRREYAALRRLWPMFAQKTAGDVAFAVPKPVFMVEDLGALVTDHCAGQRLDKKLRWVRYGMSERRFEDLATHLMNCGKWLGTFQQLTIGGESPANLLDMRATTFRDNVTVCERLGLGTSLADFLRTAFQESSFRSDVADYVVTGRHCDFAPWNVFVGQDRLTVIDFEGYQEGLHLDDVAYFLCHLQATSSLHLSTSQIAGMRKEFEAGYISAGGFSLSGLEFHLMPTMVAILAHDPLMQSGSQSPARLLQRKRKWAFYKGWLTNWAENAKT